MANPILASTGAIFIIPGIISLYNQKYYGGMSTMLLGLTSVGFHLTHNPIIELIDRVAITNFVISGYMLTNTESTTAQLIFTSCFNVAVFFVGMKYHILCFDPDTNIQNLYHALIHIFSAHVAYRISIQQSPSHGTVLPTLVS